MICVRVLRVCDLVLSWMIGNVIILHSIFFYTVNTKLCLRYSVIFVKIVPHFWSCCIVVDCTFIKKKKQKTFQIYYRNWYCINNIGTVVLILRQLYKIKLNDLWKKIWVLVDCSFWNVQYFVMDIKRLRWKNSSVHLL